MAMNGNSKIATEKQKLIQEKCLTILTNMLKDEDNKYCVDCDAKGPRWASWNLGVFLCIRCAGIHRNLGVHISKVKSVNLDTWKPEQAVALQQMGNSRARAVYEANLPDNFRRPQTDSALESFIRAKYEHNKYTAREWVPPRPPKVNWDAEIEAALKEQRSARRGGRRAADGPPPALSKPLPAPAAAPLPLPPAAAAPAAAQSRAKARTAEPPPPAAAAAPAPPVPASADLLGLDAPAAAGSSDPFGDFLAASPATDPAAPAVSVPAGSAGSQSASDEASFFSQPAPAPASTAASVLSRDSILALYGQAGGGGGPAGGGVPGYPAPPAVSAGSAAFPGLPAATGMPSMSVAGTIPGMSTAGGMPASATPGFPGVSAAGGFLATAASYPAYSAGYQSAQQLAGLQQQQLAGLQQQQYMGLRQQQQQQLGQQQHQLGGLHQQQLGGVQQQFQQQAVGGFQQAPAYQQYAAGAAFGQGYPGVQPVSLAAQQQQPAGFPAQLQQQMAGLSVGRPAVPAAGLSMASVPASAGFPPAGAAPMGGQLWQ